MNFKKAFATVASVALVAVAFPALAGPQGRDTTYGAASGAVAGGLLSHSVGGAVVGGVGGALVGNAIGRHQAHRYHHHHGYYHHG